MEHTIIWLENVEKIRTLERKLNQNEKKIVFKMWNCNVQYAFDWNATQLRVLMVKHSLMFVSICKLKSELAANQALQF